MHVVGSSADLSRSLGDSPFVKAMTATILAAAPLLVVLHVVTTAEVEPPVRPVPPFCSWSTTLNCYTTLVPDIGVVVDEHGRGHIHFEHYAAECARLALPSPCYGPLMLCPEKIKTNVSFFEDGYKRIRDFICDRNELEEVRKLYSCLNPRLIEHCIDKYLPEASAQHGNECGLGKAQLSCVDEIFPMSCTADLQAAKATFGGLIDAMLLLHGCERSSQGSPDPQRFLMGLAATIFLLLLKST